MLTNEIIGYLQPGQADTTKAAIAPEHQARLRTAGMVGYGMLMRQVFSDHGVLYSGIGFTPPKDLTPGEAAWLKDHRVSPVPARAADEATIATMRSALELGRKTIAAELCALAGSLGIQGTLQDEALLRYGGFLHIPNPDGSLPESLTSQIREVPNGEAAAEATAQPKQQSQPAQRWQLAYNITENWW